MNMLYRFSRKSILPLLLYKNLLFTTLSFIIIIINLIIFLILLNHFLFVWLIYIFSDSFLLNLPTKYKLHKIDIRLGVSQFIFVGIICHLYFATVTARFKLISKSHIFFIKCPWYFIFNYIIICKFPHLYLCFLCFSMDDWLLRYNCTSFNWVFKTNK